MTRKRIATTLLFVLALVVTPAAGAVAAAPGDAGPTHAATVNEQNQTQQAAACSYPTTVRDATGEEVEIGEEPERVVTLGPASAQTMWELDATSKVVGVTQFASYLDGADEKANVSGEGRMRVSIEKVVAQEPDVVLAENVTSSETVQSLRDAGITVYYFNRSESIEDVYQKVGTTGKIVGECDAAVETVRWMKEEMAIVAEATDGEEKRDFLYALYGYTAGENTFIHEALTAAGGNNLAVGVVDFPPSGYAPINPETVANLSVEWIVYPGTEAAIPQNEAWQQTTAVQEGNLVAVDENHISQPAPRVVLAVRHLAKTWYPDQYASANESLRGNVEVEVDLYPDQTSTEETTADDATTGDDQMTTAGGGATTTHADDSSGTPGFGPIVALLAAAVLVVGTLARRD